MMTTTLERFTLVAVCPGCGAVDTHDMAAPHFAPPPPSPEDNTPLAEHQRFVADIVEMLDILSGTNLYDPPGTQVARICRVCQHRWGQR